MEQQDSLRSYGFLPSESKNSILILIKLNYVLMRRNSYSYE